MPHVIAGPAVPGLAWSLRPSLGRMRIVVVSDSPVTRGILKNGEHAVVVPPADQAAMRAAIVKVCEDGAYRAHVAHTGRGYALSLGDESRLGDDIFREAISAMAR